MKFTQVSYGGQEGFFWRREYLGGGFMVGGKEWRGVTGE